MKQNKKSKKLNKTEVQEAKQFLIYNKEISQKYNVTIKWLLVLASVLTGVYFLYTAYEGNGYFSFPLDDSWIHLTFAKNIIEYGSFSYFKDEMVTAGSTSPVYTLLLALLFVLSKNEFIISYIIGILFSAVTVYYLYKSLQLQFTDSKWIIPAAVILIALHPRIGFLAVSGMETTMFIALIALALFFYKNKKSTALGVVLGLIIWCRPDGLVLWAVILFDQMLLKYWIRKDKVDQEFSNNELIKIYLIAIVLLISYFLMNYFISGYFLPNTFRSKVATYQNIQRSDFINNDIISFFSSSEFVFIWITFIISLVKIFLDIISRRFNSFVVYLLFVIGLPMLYYIQLPSASMYGRYLVPIIPFYIILSFHGIKTLVELIAGRQKSPVLANVLIILFTAAGLYFTIAELSNNSEIYKFSCKYYNDRHAVTGKWIEKNTPSNAVVATHDIGAIGFYGNRKVIDMVGLVNPGIIKNINSNFTGFLNTYLVEQRVDYVVTLRSWFEVVNDNPVFSPVTDPEIIEVFRYKPGKTYIQNGNASAFIKNGIGYMNNGDAVNAEKYFTQAVIADDKSSRTHFILGYLYFASRNTLKAEEQIKKSLEIFPESPEANYLMARLKYEKKDLPGSKFFLQKAIDASPGNIEAVELLKQIDKYLQESK